MRAIPMALGLILTLGGCQTMDPPAPDTNRPQTADYRAVGTEPFWSLTIAGKAITFTPMEGKAVTMRDYDSRTTFNGWRHSGKAMTLDITRSACSDGMSDRRYADTVMVMTGGQTFYGCGGAILPPASLIGTSWRFVAINGQPVSSEREASLSFEADRLSGTAGCNRFFGGYTLRDATITAPALASTMMACPAPFDTQERAFFNLFAKPVILRYTDAGNMLLSGPDGSAELEQSF